MSFLHIYLKTTNFKHSYELTAKPELDEATCLVIHETFQAASNELIDVYPGTCQSSISSHPYINKKDKGGVPGDLQIRSEMTLSLLHGLESEGWELLLGKSIHDHEGMIFKRRRGASWMGKRRGDEIEMMDGCSLPKSQRR